MLTENTATTTIESTYNYVSSAGRPITLAINAGNTGAEGWTITDGIATLIFKKTSNGYNITRRKVGYTAIGTAIVDTFGNLVSQTNNLTASLSSTFSGSVSWLNSHLQANPDAVGAKDKVTTRAPGSFSCRGAMVLGGLAIVSETVLFTAVWIFSGGIWGVIAIPTYILFVHQTNEWTLNNCREAGVIP